MNPKLIKNKPLFLFDVDGTLTKPRHLIEEDFKEEFLKWVKDNNVIFVTGSDFSKTVEQLGEDVIDAALYTFCCMGNELRLGRNFIIYSKSFEMTKKLKYALKRILGDSPYPQRTGNHIETRIGMVNFSTIGRNASLKQRKEYSEWDSENNERNTIASRINKEFPALEASIGGQISIDIIPKGNNKSQAIDYIVDYLYPGEIQQIVFFGDRMDPGGNDYSIVKKAETCKKIVCHPVTGPHETLDILKNSYFSP